MSVPRHILRSDFSVPRLIKGNWQIADDHSGAVNDDNLYEHMAAFVDAGVTAFDCGDIYYGVEEKIGRFIARYRSERGDEAASKIAVHTKFCPCFLQDGLRDLKRGDIEAVIDRSLKRLQIERLDLVQMHWWNYEIPGNVEAALVLRDLQKAGKIHQIGGTNYNVRELSRMVAAGVDVVVNQVQYSLLDRRAKNGMTAFAKAHGIGILGYGSLAGGLFSERWLGIPDPQKPAFENVSLDKYYRIVVDFGGWSLFQDLLAALKKIGDRHGVGISAIAARWVLEQAGVAAIIQGARHARHLAANLKLFDIALDAEDLAAIDAILKRSTGPLGDCYDLDREENRDADENVATEYFDVRDGKLEVLTRAPVVVAEPYGHHIRSEDSAKTEV